jgi:hypothetical protein
MSTTTELASKCDILNDIWINSSDHEFFENFIDVNDLGLPLAYFLMNEIVLPTLQSAVYIDETYNLFIASLGVEDKEWESLDELLGSQA